MATDLTNTRIADGYGQLLHVDGGLGSTEAGVYDGDGTLSVLKLGSASASIIDGAYNFDIASHDGSNGLQLGGTLVTSSAAELNYLDIATLGTSQASKAVTVNSSGDLIVPDSDKFKFGTGSDMQIYHDGSNSYITNAVGALKVATETSGIAITIGHTTSETTIADNLTVTGNTAVGGNLTVTGTSTFNGGTINLGDASSDTIAFNGTITSNLVFEGSTSNAHELTLSAGDPTGDRTVTLPDSTDTLIGKATTDTLTNKTLTSPDINAGTVDGVTSLTVGTDGSGADVYFYSGTSGDHLFWDSSEELLTITGTNGQTALNVADGNVTVSDTLTATNIGAFTLSGKLTAGSTEIEGSAFDIDGGDISSATISGGLTWTSAQNLNSQNLTNVNIDSGTVDAITSLTVGTDGSGSDVYFYSATSGDHLFWDASEEKLTITGTNGQTALDVADGNLVVADNIDLEGDIDVNGTANLDVVDIDGAVDMATTLTLGGNADFNGDLDVDGTANLDNTDIDGTLVVDGSNISLDSTSTLNIDNSNTSNGVTIATATSGVPISLGHSTSETTVNDNLTVSGNATVSGNLLVVGDSSEVKADNLVVDNPTIAMGLTNGSAPSADSGFDLGLKPHWHTGLGAKTAFLGVDVSTSASAPKLTYIPDASFSSDVVSGTAGTIVADLEGDVTGDVTGTADVATSFTASANNSANETVYPVFVDGATGSQGAETDTGLTYNPSSGLLTSTGFSGNLTGTLQTASQGNVTSLGTLTTLTIDNVILNGTTIGHTSDTDLMTLADGVLTVAGEVSMTTLDIGGTNVTATASELNLIDGGTSRGTTAVASGDGILINDAGTMRMTNVDTVSTYFSSHNVGGGNVVTTGALNSGSITSGFGNIDTGSSTITTTGLISGGSLDIDNVLINGTTIGHTDDTDLITVADGLVTVAGEISVTTLDIGGTNITSTPAEINILDGDNSASSVTIADADRIILNDNGTMKQVAVTALNTYTSGSIAADDLTVGDGAVTLSTSSGNITIDATANDTDIIFKGTDNTSDITMLTLDGSEAGAATFNNKVVATELDISGNADIDGTLEADAITVNDATLQVVVEDHVGNMLDGTETGIAVSYDATDNNLDFVIDAAQTTITSLLATDIKIGEDDQTKIDFETADEIHFYANNVEQVYLADNVFGPQSDSDVDLGTTGVRWKDAFVDSITVTGEVDAATLDISGAIDVAGTSNLDIVDIDGAVDMASTLTVAGVIDSNDTTDSSSKTTGSVKIAGGVGIEKKLYVGTDLDVDGVANLDNVDIDGTLNVATGSVLTGIGRVVQVVSQTKTGLQTASSTDFTIGSMSATLTPSNSANKVLVICHISYNHAGSQYSYFELHRDTTAICIGDASNGGSGARGRATVGAKGLNELTTHNVFFNYLDSPNTTSEISYSVKVNGDSISGSYIFYINAFYGDTDATYAYRGSSTITAMEIQSVS